MARKWGATRKRAAGGRRRRRFREEEEEDDEYVAEEEEEEEEEESVNSEDSEDEASFEFMEDTSSDESDEVAAAPKRRRSGAGVRKKQRKKNRVSHEDEAGESRVNRSQRRGRSSASGPVDDEGDDDEDFLPDAEDYEEETMRKRNQCGRKRKLKASKGNVRKRKKSAVAVPARRTHRMEEDPADKKKRRRKKRGSSDSESSDSDFVVSGDDSLGMDISDHAFVASDDGDFAVRDRGRVVKDGPKKKRSVRRNNRRLLNSDILSFNCVIREKDAKDAGNGANTNMPKRGNGKEKEKRDSETSDSDYVVSDDEIGAMSGSDSDFNASDDDFIVRDRNRVIDGTQKKSRAARKNDTMHKPRNKRRSLNPDALSFDCVTRAEDSRDIAIGDTPDVPQLKSEEKGKEKAADVFEKQVCGICLSEEHKETVRGVLDCCPHYFCFTCIMDWSKVESKCPVCKRRFKTICRTTRSDPWFGFRNAVVNVPKRDQVYQPTVEEIRSLIDPYENVVCMVCQQGCHDNLMLLCDICDSPAHTYCVGLEGEIPEGNWYCDGCRTVDDGSPNSQVQGTGIDQGTSSNNLFETEDLGTSMHASTSSQQLTPLPGQTSSQIFDLNVSPRHLPVEDHGVSSLAIFTRLSTLSGPHMPEQQRCLQDTRLRQTEISFSGSSSSQVKDAVVNQETGNSYLSSGGRETQNLSSNMHGNASRSAMPLSGHSSLQNIDLNISPRNLSGEDHGVVSQASGSGASTLSGRRAMHRIHMLLSDSRLRELFHRTYVPSRNVERM